MKHTLLHITSVLFFVFSSSVFAKLGGNQPVVPVGGNGVLTVPVHRKPTLPGDPGADKRQVDTDLLNPLYGLSYFVDLDIGTPAQSVIVVLDTGSSELWVNPTCSSALSASQAAWCKGNPVYDSAKSSSVVDQDESGTLSYGQGSVTGEYLEDVVSVNGVQVPNTIFLDASKTTGMAAGVWGVCFGAALNGQEGNIEYYGLLDLMYLDGIINSRAFSLDLMNVDTAEGAIIFGGIDTMRYIGALEKRPIIPGSVSPDGVNRYWIYMSSFGVTRKGISNTLSAKSSEQAVYLDSGSTISYLPTSIVTDLISHFPEAVSLGNGLWQVPCTLRSEVGTIDFGFGMTIIRVSFHEAIWQPDPTQPQCLFGIGASDTNWVLGDTMLRGAFVVYDQDNANLLLAQAANCGSNVVPIGSGVDAVPSLTGQCTATPTARSSTSITQSATSTSSSSITSSTSSCTTSSVISASPLEPTSSSTPISLPTFSIYESSTPSTTLSPTPSIYEPSTPSSTLSPPPSIYPLQPITTPAQAPLTITVISISTTTLETTTVSMISTVTVATTTTKTTVIVTATGTCDALC